MPFTFQERPNSRPSSLKDQTVTLEYVAQGEHDDVLVGQLAYQLSPAAVATPIGVLFRQDLRLRPGGHKLYYVTVPYGKRKLDPGTYTWNFDTTGGTVRIYAGREHINSYPADGNNPNPHKGLIGVKQDGSVEGVDVTIPSLKLTYSFKHPQAIVTEAFARVLARNTGKTNSDIFRGFAPGELLYLGSTGSDGTDTEASVDYHFAASEELNGFSIGDFNNISKGGHEYLWIQFEPEVDGAGAAATKPKRVHIERIFAQTNFANTFGWN